MKRISILLLVFFACFAVAAWPQAQTQTKYQQYKLYDLGTLGGPDSVNQFFVISLTDKGVIGGAQTAAADPFNPNCHGQFLYDMIQTGCYVMHAFLWNHGILTDLGALPGNDGNNSSVGGAINNHGLIAGLAENGSVDPDTGYPEAHAVVWDKGKIRDLGTLGGTQSAAWDVNDLGQVVGGALNATEDPLSAGFGLGYGMIWTGTTQMRAFVWQNGVMRDLGTLGGPDAFAIAINQFGQIAGESYTSYNSNSWTGIPRADPFLWTNGKMIDLGTLGGTIGYSVWLNDRGQVVGGSNLAGDLYSHGFLWDRGLLRDLRPPQKNGGNYSWVYWINELGDVVGGATLSGDQLNDAILWRFGKPIDLGTIGQDVCSEATGMNDFGQIVGISNECSGPWDPSGWATMRAFLWQQGGPMVDLNALVENFTNLHLYWGAYINDSGEILAQGLLSTGDIHAALLVPSGDCKEDCERRILASQNAPTVGADAGLTSPAFGKQGKWLHNRLGQRYALPGQH
jgi:probable HAF family extracellular repeat protein